MTQQLSKTNWKTIDTAPRDGTAILVFVECQGWDVVGWARWADYSGVKGWMPYGFSDIPGVLGLANPSHWQPIPSPPTANKR
jgi:hypothetical protein